MMERKKVFLTVLLCVVAVCSVRAGTVFINTTVGADLLTAANWDNGLPDNIANPGTIGTTGDSTGPFNVTTVARNFAVGRTISIYGSSKLIYNVALSYRDDTGATLNLYDDSQFIMAPNNGTTILSSQDCPLDAGTYNIYNNAKWTGFDDITGAITINVYDNGYINSRRLGVKILNLYGGEFFMGSDQGDGNLVQTDGITEWVNLIGTMGGTSGKIVHNGDYVAAFKADIDADRIRINGGVNTDGDYSSYSIVYDGATTTVTIIPEPATLLKSVNRGCLLICAPICERR